MSQTTHTPARRASTVFASGPISMGPRPNHYRRGDGTLVVEGQPVFRTGTFRDSMGRQGTWEPLHIDQMVAHYEMLKNRNILADVPVRDGHPGFLISGQEGSGKVVGWHTSLEAKAVETDGKKITYLVASYVLTEPEAAEKYERGTYRNRSSEVGTYITNDEAEFWPVYMGVAFVDLPAVEGLNNVEFSKSGASDYAERDVVFLFDRESPLSTPVNQPSGGTQNSQPPQQPQIQPQLGAPILPPALHTQAPVQPQAPAVQAFMINGQSITDVGQVQAHITTLETFRNETLEAARVQFVTSLVESNRLLASQQESMTAFAKGLSGEQFASWKTAMEAGPQIPALGLHGAPSDGGTRPATGGAPDAATAELDSARSIVRMHELAGKSKEFIEKTASYQTIQRLTGAKS